MSKNERIGPRARHLGRKLRSKIRRRVLDLGLRVVGGVPTPLYEALLRSLINARTRILPPGPALRFLFRLDAALYKLEGEKSIEYGGGLHTKHGHTSYHDFFVGRVRSGERVLDLGCGIGALAYDVACETEASVVGLDLSPDNVAIARQRYTHPRIEYRVGDARLDLDGQHFDVVILSNLLEHLPERPQFLRRVVHQTGAKRILIRVPLFERDWRVPLKLELGVEWRLDPTHETEYTGESFADEVTKAGLIIAHQKVRWGEIWAELAPADA